MAFRLVSSGGNVVDPTFINCYASGTIQRNSVVILNRSSASGVTSFNVVSPAAQGSTQTQIVGVSLDYVQGFSDTFVKVIPFTLGQIWECDTVSAVSTANIGLHHELGSAINIANTSYDNSGVAGVFLCYNLTSSTTGSGKLIGEFIRLPGYGATYPSGSQ